MRKTLRRAARPRVRRRRRPTPAPVAPAALEAVLDRIEEYAVFTTDPEGRIASWNHSARRVFGYSDEEVLGRPGEILFTEEDAAAGEARKEFETAKRDGCAPDERWHRRKGGERFWVHGVVLAMRGPAGELTGLLKIGRDMTRIRASERAELAAQKRLKDVTDAVSAFISYVTPDHRYAFCNAAYRRVFGYETTGKLVCEVIGEEAYGIAKPYLEGAFAGEHLRFTSRARYRDGQPRWVHAEYVPDKDEQGRVRGVIALVTDVTDAKQLELELAEARDRLEHQAEALKVAVEERTAELEEALSELEAFAYTVSHDLRAPIRAIQGLLEMQLHDLDAPPQARKDRMERVVRATKRMDALIRDLLAYSRIGRVAFEIGPVDLDEVVDEITQRIEFQDKEIEVRRPLGRVVGHRSLLSQAVANLVDNAAKFVREGERPKIRVSAERRDGRVRLIVADRGIGVEPALLEKIFRPFERVHAPDRYEGTGIGLAIVRRTAERLGGRAGAESEPGEGSRFWIELPEA